MKMINEKIGGKYNSVLKQVILIVKKACESDDRWKYHIYPVVKYGKLLASKLKADKEIVELACWLHDLTRIKGDVKNHHMTSANEAGEILSGLDYNKEKIEKIQNCIRSHRGSVKIKKNSIEEEIVASADAIAHFSFAIILFYSAFGRKKLSLEDGTRWISDKIERSWNKISLPEAKKLARHRYLEIKDILVYKK